MPEIECPQCGHRALSVATRCPRCGNEFPPDLIQPLPSTADRHWVRWSLMGAGALVLIIAIGRFGRYESASGKPTSSAAVDTTPRDTASRSAPPPTAAAPRQPQAQQQPKPTPAQPPQQRPAPPQAVPPPTQPATPPIGDQQQRYATVFVNVRQSRSPTATTVAVLKPGDAVLVDSLRRGWYRIVRDGRTLGYADRRFLATSPR
jgi:DNA-directed RNA polymerase subunit RPC12/RpoP